MALEVQFLSPESSRDELVAALLLVNKEARRCLTRNNLSELDAHWGELHDFMNALLDMLED